METEKISMEIINIFHDANVEENINKYLVIDSLSALMIYNDPETVTEFFYHLINKTRTENIHSISLVVEEEETNKYLNKIIFLNDKILERTTRDLPLTSPDWIDICFPYRSIYLLYHSWNMSNVHSSLRLSRW